MISTHAGLGSESEEKKEGERSTKHQLLETRVNYTQWFIGHDRCKREEWKRNAKYIMGRSPPAA